MAIYMKYGAVDGEVKTEGFDKWIELQSVSWGVGRAVSSGAGGVSKREASTPSLAEVSVTKTMDNSTPELLKEALGGKMNTEVKISLTRTDTKGKHVAFQTFTLTNTAISGYSISSAGDHPSESISLNFTKIESKHQAVGHGLDTKPKQFIFDIETAKLS